MVKPMRLKNTIKCDRKIRRLLISFLCIACALSANLTGCTNRTKTNTVDRAACAEQIHPIKTARNRTSPAETEIANRPLLSTINVYENQDRPATPSISSSASQTAQGESIIDQTQRKAVPSPSHVQIHTSNETLATSESPLTQQNQTYSETTVNIPLFERPGMAEELVSVNFEQVDIRTVLKTIGDITGINFVLDERVRGTVTVMSPTKIPLSQIYDFLQSILEVHGYAAVPADDLVKIVPKDEAVKRNLQVRIGSDPTQIPKSDSLVTQIIPLTYADVSEVGQIIQPLLATGSQMAIYPRTNSIVITDTSSNIHHIAKIIRKIDVEGLKEHIIVIPLKHASAQTLSDQITQIMQKSRAVSPQSARARGPAPNDIGIKILPDTRTNSLIVVAGYQDIETVREFVEQLDVQRPTGTDNVHVVYLKNAQSKEVAESLTAALTNLRIAGAVEGTQPIQVTADEGTNSLIIAASAQDYEVISEIIDKLDIVREQVLVEMLIVEVSEDTLREIGIDWATLDNAVSSSIRFFGATNFGPRVDFASGDLEGLAVGAWKADGSNVSIAAILHALERESGVNILSTPHITTSNHQKAKIIVGENVPFVTQSRITETDPSTPTNIKTYEYKDVGISLEITPHVSQNSLVRLELNSEFTKLYEDATSLSTDTPITAKRQAQTVVSMKSGSTIVIGGLIRDDKVTVEQKVPFVGDFPLVGNLFKHKRDRFQKTNLLIFITPRVMKSQEDLDQVTQEKKSEMTPELE